MKTPPLAALVLSLALAGSASAGPTAYVAENHNSRIAVVDLCANQVATEIPVGTNPHFLAANPGGSVVYATHGVIDRVSVIDTATNAVTATIPVGGNPIGVRVHPSGAAVYVANSFGNSISVIDAATNAVSATVPVGEFPVLMAMNAAGTRLYTANAVSNDVTVVSTETNAAISTIPIGPRCVDSCLHGVALHPAEDRLYVGGGSSVYVVDLAVGAVAATVEVGSGANGVEVTPDGTRVYANSHWTNTVTAIDAATNAVVATIPVGANPIGLAIHPAGVRVYNGNHWGYSLSVIDPATNQELTKIPVHTPMGIAIVGADPVPYSISGHVRTRGGGPPQALPGVTVALSGSAAAVATTGPDGAYSFTGLMNCPYQVTPSLEGFAFSPPTRRIAVEGDVSNASFNAR